MQLIEKRRNKWLVAILFIFWPGLGHLYCGKPGKAVYLISGYVLTVLSFDRLFSLSSSPVYYLLFISSVFGFLLFCAVDAWRIANRSQSVQIRWFNRWYVYTGLAILFGAVNLFGFEMMETKWKSYHSATPYMEPTLLLGDRFLVRLVTSQNNLPARGEVVLFRNPQHPEQEWVRRLVGFPGDRIQLIGGFLHINGARVKREELHTTNGGKQYRETFPDGSSHTIFEQKDDAPSDETKEYIVSKGQVFVLGDNRDRAEDSRRPNPGTIPVENILGIAELIYWSSDFELIGKYID